ncbi:MAG: helix-turn-helix transcriptional regulator [Thermoplasmatales archaeon]|nr:helix-turn-helix transcriptional regulator [Thermoplasmatales archaeon]
MVDVDSIGKKWSGKILFALKDGTKRFNQLLKLSSNLNKKISSRTLANRLKELEEQELVSRDIVSGRPPTSTYKLTNKGKKAIELISKLRDL